MHMLVAMLVGRGRAGDRPAVFTVLFWIGMVLPWLARLEYLGADLVPDPVLAVVTVVVLVVWGVLGWSPQTGNRRICLSFGATTIVFSMLDGSGYSFVMMLVALAAIVLTAGARLAVAMVAVQVVIMAISMPLFYDRNWFETTTQIVASIVLTACAIALSQLIAAERRARAGSDRLLTELAAAHDELTRSHAELATTHAELQRRSNEIRELAVSSERARLAREVHDAVGHHLTVVKLDLTNALRYRTVDQEAAWQEVADARAAVGNALDEVRRAVRAMGPAPLAQSSMGAALRTLADSYDGNGLAVSFDTTGSVRTLPPDVAATLYRVAEEGLTNVHRHAVEATRASVRLSYEPTGVTLTVSDDGRSTGPLQIGFGLAGAQNRLAEAGGELAVDRPADGGVRLTARVPQRAA